MTDNGNCTDDDIIRKILSDITTGKVTTISHKDLLLGFICEFGDGRVYNSSNKKPRLRPKTLERNGSKQCAGFVVKWETVADGSDVPDFYKVGFVGTLLGEPFYFTMTIKVSEDKLRTVANSLLKELKEQYFIKKYTRVFSDNDLLIWYCMKNNFRPFIDAGSLENVLVSAFRPTVHATLQPIVLTTLVDNIQVFTTTYSPRIKASYVDNSKTMRWVLQKTQRMTFHETIKQPSREGSIVDSKRYHDGSLVQCEYYPRTQDFWDSLHIEPIATLPLGYYHDKTVCIPPCWDGDKFYNYLSSKTIPWYRCHAQMKPIDYRGPHPWKPAYHDYLPSKKRIVDSTATIERVKHSKGARFMEFRIVY